MIQIIYIYTRLARMAGSCEYGCRVSSCDILSAKAMCHYGQTDTFSIQGFGANESVSIIWNYQHAGQFTIDTVTTDASGNYCGWALPVPSTPNQSNIIVAAVGNTSKLFRNSHSTKLCHDCDQSHQWKSRSKDKGQWWQLWRRSSD